VQTDIRLAVSKATGTQGDTLVAWGLAIFVAEVLVDERVRLSDAGDHYLIESSAAPRWAEEHIATFSWQERLNRGRLRWLGSTANKRLPRDDPTLPWVDRDALREAHTSLRQSRTAMQTPSQGEGPAITTGEDPELYPFYEVLTNPGRQWGGYNSSLIEPLYDYLTPDGVRDILRRYAISHLTDTAANEQARSATKRAKVPSLNPPGFLYPGMNKGPTMRLIEEHGGSVGQTGQLDWMLADRGDRSLFEVYLAYVGYFNVARVVTTKEQRIVAAPMPAQVEIPRVLSFLPQRELEATNLTDYLAASNALDYARAALAYLASLQADRGAALGRRGVALSGAHLSVFWRPNGNVYAPSRLVEVSIPIWLAGLSEQGIDLAAGTTEQHQKRLRSVRGRWRDERKLSLEQRHAVEAYLRSLGGGLLEWFHAVAAWFPATRAAARNDWNVGLWSVDEVRRIATVMDTDHTFDAVMNHPAFARLASAIRLSTVVPHISRSKQRQGQATPPYPFDPDYDLVSTLQGAADRGWRDFLREFYAFAARYNDETARPNKGGRRPYLREDDLAQLARWLDHKDLRQLVPAALLAFGTSLKGQPAPAGDEDAAAEGASDLGNNDEEAESAQE
jgi:hypothetical protein